VVAISTPGLPKRRGVYGWSYSLALFSIVSLFMCSKTFFLWVAIPTLGLAFYCTNEVVYFCPFVIQMKVERSCLEWMPRACCGGWVQRSPKLCLSGAIPSQLSFPLSVF
jgi:hypothetical protein